MGEGCCTSFSLCGRSVVWVAREGEGDAPAAMPVWDLGCIITSSVLVWQAALAPELPLSFSVPGAVTSQLLSSPSQGTSCPSEHQVGLSMVWGRICQIHESCSFTEQPDVARGSRLGCFSL